MVLSIKPKLLSELDPVETPPKLNLLVVTVHGPYVPVANPSGQAKQPLQLTENGKGLMQHVGELLMMRYENHFRQLLEFQEKAKAGKDVVINPIQVTAIDKNIAKKSAEEIITGIKRQGKELGQKLKIELSRKNMDKNDYFDPIRLRYQEYGICDHFENRIKKLKDPKKLEFSIFYWMKIRKIVNSSPAPNQEKDICKAFDKQKSGDKDSKKQSNNFLTKYRNTYYEDVFREFESLQMMFLEGCELPDWTKGKKVHSYLAEMRNIAITRMKHLIGKDYGLWRFFYNDMIKGVFEEFEIKDDLTSIPTVRKDRDARLHIHVVDEHLMSALIFWLRVEHALADAYLVGQQGHDFYPQVGDSLLFEIDDRIFLKPSYIRTVEHMYSGVGWTQLSLYNMIENSAAYSGLLPDKSSKTPQSSYDASYLCQGLLSERESWKWCCETGRC